MIRVEGQNLFKWKHYQPDIILLTVRWYLQYHLSFHNLVEVMEERGVSMAHTTIMRWIHQYSPELDKRSGVISGKRMPHEESMRPISR